MKEAIIQCPSCSNEYSETSHEWENKFNEESMCESCYNKKVEEYEKYLDHFCSDHKVDLDLNYTYIDSDPDLSMLGSLVDALRSIGDFEDEEMPFGLTNKRNIKSVLFCYVKHDYALKIFDLYVFESAKTIQKPFLINLGEQYYLFANLSDIFNFLIPFIQTSQILSKKRLDLIAFMQKIGYDIAKESPTLKLASTSNVFDLSEKIITQFLNYCAENKIDPSNNIISY